MGLAQEVAAEAARTAFSGVVRVDQAGGTRLEAAFGLADRAHEVPNTTGTLFAVASGTKGLTALTIMALVERGVLRLDTPARELLGADLPEIAEEVTIEHLLAHRSGIGDYLEEASGADITDEVLSVPSQRLTDPSAYLPMLEGVPTQFRAGESFAYNNSGYVVLALLAERATGTGWPDLVRTLVTEPAGMTDTAFLRSDELPGRAARGYLYADGLRTNAFLLPVIGSGDGGIYSTAADWASFWRALWSGAIVSREAVVEMTRPRSDWAEEDRRYGLGFHLAPAGDEVFLEGYDAGVCFVTSHTPSTQTTYTVISNWSQGAWPLWRLLDQALRPNA